MDRRPLDRSARTFLSTFREHVDARGDAAAITQDRLTLTYSQLDRRSDALAMRLRSRGVGAETLVGVMLHRSPDLLVALLGILKAGGAYLPLDPTLPPDRLAFMIGDARPALMVSESSLAAQLPADRDLICLDREGEALETSTDCPVTPIEPWNRAYVIYTSGSTGRPKGVEIPYGAVNNLLESFAERPGLGPSDVVLAHTTLSFDISVLDLWLPLFVGARIVLTGPEHRTDARLIANLLARHRVTFLQATPSLWRLLLDTGWGAGRGLTALSGGEALSRDLANALLATGAEVWNVYGPTETTVWSAIWKVTSDGPILIGDPIRHTDLHLVDEHLEPVPDGEIGELCIGGAGLARGYLHRPSLTAEKFVPHPFSSTPDARLYRTGDLARRLGDAGIECLGRVDDQVKIDGYRIEPGEIEATLARHDAVRQAIVCSVERGPGDTRLVAYIVHTPAARPDVHELLALARAQLPTYMVPSAFVMLTEVPLTPRGKIDKRALPAPDWHSVARAETAGLRTAVEEQLTRIWCDVLGTADVGLDDNFFDVGGRSRLGAQVFARIEKELGARLPLATLFESPTIRGLAHAIEGSDATSARWQCLVTIHSTGSRLPLFFVHPVGGNVLAYRDLARRLGPDIPCYGLQARGLNGVEEPLTTVEDMAWRYLDEIRSVQPHGPYQLCGFSFGGLVAFEMALALQARSEDVGLLALLDTDLPDYPAVPPFEWLARSPLFRRRVYPTLQRARRHLRSLRRLGLRGYLKATAPRAATHESDADPISVVAERVRKANTRAAIHYVPRRFNGVLTYFRARHPGDVRDDKERWRALAREADIIDVPGGHSDLRLEPQVQTVARELLTRLDRVARASHVA